MAPPETISSSSQEFSCRTFNQFRSPRGSWLDESPLFEMLRHMIDQFLSLLSSCFFAELTSSFLSFVNCSGFVFKT